MMFAEISSSADFKGIRIEKSSAKQAAAFFEEVCRTSTVLNDGTIIQFKKVVPYADARPIGQDRTASRGWKWELDEAVLRRNGLRYVATEIVENVGEGKYAVQHLAFASPVEPTNPNYILVIPWDQDLMAGAWVEGLARPCGTRDYPIGHGVTKPKEAFEMIAAKAPDRAAFVESLKKGAVYQALLSSDTRCPRCKGSGRVRNKSSIGKSRKDDTIPCNVCVGTGKVPTNTPYAVSW